MKTLHIASPSDLKYFPGLEVLVASTLLNTSRNNAVHFHILDGGIPESHWVKLQELSARLHPSVTINRLSFDKALFEGFPSMFGNRMTYARLLLGNLLPHVDKLIYIDSDILVGRDPEELLELDMAGHTILATPDFTLARLDEDCPWLEPEVSRHFRYFNAGVLVLDLARWRELHYFEKCMAALVEKPSGGRFWDQSALNYLLREDVSWIPQEFNWYCSQFTKIPKEPANFHFCGAKPWLSYARQIDHPMWRAFYRDVIDPERQWPVLSSSSRKLELLSLHPATRWLFRLIMRGLIMRSNHEHQRQMRETALREALDSARFLARPRSRWKTQLANAKVRA